MTSSPTRRRVRIGRLDLDLRGISPDTAEATARAVGPALTRALTPSQVRGVAAARIDAGRITLPASPSVHDLAAGIAARIAHALRWEGR